MTTPQMHAPGMKLDILLRTCSRVHSVHGGQRIYGYSKTDVILQTLRSLAKSIQFVLSRNSVPISLTIFDDRSDEECLQRMRGIVGGRPFQTRFIGTRETGNGASIAETLQYARQNCDGMIYFVEDDYLHSESAIHEMIEAHSHLSSWHGSPVVIFPCDYPDRYHAPYPSLVLAGKHRYWRTIQHTTGTFLTTRQILERYWNHYLGLSRYGIDPGVCEDNTINLIYREVPCFSPMPTLAIHFQNQENLSPFTDLDQWIANHK